MNCNRAKRLSYIFLYDLYGLKILASLRSALLRVEVRGTLLEYQMLTSRASVNNKQLITDNRQPIAFAPTSQRNLAI